MFVLMISGKFHIGEFRKISLKMLIFSSTPSVDDQISRNGEFSFMLCYYFTLLLTIEYYSQFLVYCSILT